MTPALSLYLLAAARAEPILAKSGRFAPQGRLRPRGEVVWIHVGQDQPPQAASALASRIEDERPQAHFIITSDTPSTFERWASSPRPVDFPQAVDAFLTAWAPNVAVWIGGPLWPVLAAKARRAAVPIILANASASLAAGHRSVPARDLLALFRTVVASSRTDAAVLQRLTRIPVHVKGRLQQASKPLDHDEDEHQRLSGALRARPIWYAVRATAGEIAALQEAQWVGQGLSHRLLLILQPDDADVAASLHAAGAPRRSETCVPPDGAPIFAADVPEEEGLWYRLAAITFIGGTLGGPAARVDPFAPAALGSALLHGPVEAPFQAQFDALARIRASRLVRESDDLGPALGELLAPDRAAELAHRAWHVVSEGAEATDFVAEDVCRLLSGDA